MSDHSDDEIAVTGFHPLLPEQFFEGRFVGYSTLFIFGTAKVVLAFEVTEPGEYHGARLIRAFRVRKIKGRPRPDGKFVLHAGGDLYRTLVRLLDIRARPDRITLRPLRHMLFKIKPRTVVVDSRQRALPEGSRYSVVDEIERGL